MSASPAAIPICAAPGCGGKLPERGERGPVRYYCSDACRQAAYRARRRTEAAPVELVAVDVSELIPFTPDDGMVLPGEVRTDEGPRPLATVLDGSGMASTDEQVAAAVLAAREIAFTLGRLAHEARQPFAFRCAALGQDLSRSLSRHFGAAL